MNNRVDPPISVTIERISPLLAQARAENIDIQELLASIELDVDIANAPANTPLSLADYYRIQNRLAILIGDETLHLSSRQLLHGSTDFVLQHVGDANNLYDAMRIIARSYNLLHGGEYNSVIKRRRSIDYVIDDRTFPYANSLDSEYLYFSTESTLIFLHCMLITISASAAEAVQALHIRRPSPGGDCAHPAYWDAPIKFSSEKYKLVFDREVALSSITVPSADLLSTNAVYQKIMQVVEGQHARYQEAFSVSSRVCDALANGVVEQGDIAAQMGVSVATLRRRLSREGVSFRDLRRKILNETAKRLLSEHKPVADVAEILGFSEIRAFNRAFRDWNGITPKAFVRSSERL